MISWDLSVLHLVNREWTHPLLDWLMPAVSAVNAWLPLMGLALLLVLRHNGRRGVRLILCVAMALGRRIANAFCPKTVMLAAVNQYPSGGFS